MTPRKRVSNRRHHEVIAVEHEGQRYKIGLGREFLDGSLGPIVEVFVNAQHVNSQMDLIAGEGAILMSMLLQYGHPASEIAKSMKKNPDGSPSSPLGRAAALINEATSQGE
jgi:hypothetical protein